MKTLKLKNYHLINIPAAQVVSLPEWLSNLAMHSKESRMRTRFIKLFVERMKEIDAERIKLLKENSEKAEPVKDGEQGLHAATLEHGVGETLVHRERPRDPGELLARQVGRGRFRDRAGDHG